MNKKVLCSSFAWKFAERMLSQGLGLIVQIIIARLIVPTAVGEMAILLSVVNVFAVIVNSGFSSYLIQKRELDNETLSTVTTFGILLTIGCMMLIWGFGDELMRLIGYPYLSNHLKVLSLMLLFSTTNGICNGLLSREMQFKEMFQRTLLVLPIASAVCIFLLIKGLDLWALVAYNIANPLFTTCFMLTLLRKSKYKVRIMIKRRQLKEALPYSFRVLLQDIGNVACNSLRSVLMGNYHSANKLAYYDRAFTYTSYVEESVTYTASSVLLPAMAKEQGNKEKLRQYVEKSTNLYAFLIIPALLGFAAVAPTFTSVILTDKWLPCVPYIWIFAIGFLHYPILTIHKPAFLASGRSDVTFKVTLIQNIIAIVLILLTMKKEPLVIAGATSVALLSYIPLYARETKKFLGMSFKAQLLPMTKYALFSLIMFTAVYPINAVEINGVLKLLLQIAVGATVYIMLLAATKDKTFFDLKTEILRFLKEHKRNGK